jgi:PPP family 3-phenylpropionic acid transporter
MPKLHPITSLRTYVFLYYASALFVLGYFPLYFQSIGFSKLQIGSIFAFGPTIGIFANLFWGYISDKFQVIKRLLLFILVMQFSFVLLLMATKQYTLIFIFMLSMFFFQASITPLTDSLSLLTTQAYGKSFAGLRSFGSIGFALTALAINPVFQKIGYSYTLILYSIALAIAFVSCTQITERVGEMKRVSFKGLFKLLGNRQVVLTLLSIFILAIAHRTNDNFLSLYLKEIGMEKYLGYAFMMSALSEVPIFLLLGKYGERFNAFHLLALAAFFYAVRFFIVAQANDPVFVILAQLMHSITFGMFYITAIRVIANLLPNEYRSSGQALFTITFSGFASITSGVLGGWLYEYGSGRTLYTAISLLALVASLFFLLLSKKMKAQID